METSSSIFVKIDFAISVVCFVKMVLHICNDRFCNLNAGCVILSGCGASTIKMVGKKNIFDELLLTVKGRAMQL